MGSPWVVGTILGGYKLHFRRRPPWFRGVRVTALPGDFKGEVLLQEIASLLGKGAVRGLEPGGSVDFIPLTLWSRSGAAAGGRSWACASLAGLWFRMLSLAPVLQAVSEGQWFTSLDREDACFRVPGHPEHGEFLRFTFQASPSALPGSAHFHECVDGALVPLSLREFRFWISWTTGWSVPLPGSR